MKNLLLVIILILAHAAKASTLSVTDEQLELLLKKIELFYVEDSSPLRSTSESLEIEKVYLSQLDIAITERMSTYVDQSYNEIQKQLEDNVSSERWKKPQAEAVLALLKQKHLEFQESKKYYGTGKDFKRFNAFYSYNQSIQQLLGSDKDHSWFQKLIYLMKQIYRGLRLARPFAKLSFYTLFPFTDDNRGTPLTSAADEYFSKIAKLDSINVKFEGDRKINAANKPDEINLIISNHVSAKYDAIVLSKLNLGSYITFGALNLKGEGIFSIAMHPFFRGILKQIDKQKDVILLGREHEPVKKLIDVLKAERSPNLFLFPQGMISLGFDETNPLKPNFSEKIIKELLNAGFNVRLQLMTMPDNFEYDLSFDSTSESSKVLRAFLSKPIEDQELREIIKVSGPAALDQMIRMHWVRMTRKHNTEFLGVVSEPYLNSMTRVQTIKYCADVLNLGK